MHHLKCVLLDLFRLFFAFLIASSYPADMPVLIRTRQALVKCKVCGAQTPSLSRGVPILPARVPCSVCGTRQVYRPSEVFIGFPASKSGRTRLCADMPAPDRNHVQCGLTHKGKVGLHWAKVRTPQNESVS